LDGSKWIFILGDTSSGTTLLMYLLGMHPNINRMYGEGQNYTYNAYDYLKETGEDHMRVFTEIQDILRFPRRSVEDIKKSWSNFFMTKSGEYNLEKSPINTLRVKWLIENFENPYLIGIIRNGYSTISSVCSRGKDVRRVARHWNKVYSILLNDVKDYEKFKMIKYEDLVEDTENTLNSITDFCNIERHDWSFLNELSVTKTNYLNGLHEGKIENKNKFPKYIFRKGQLDIIREESSCILYKPPKEVYHQ